MFFNLSVYFVYVFKNIEIFFMRIIPDKHLIKFFFYCSLSFYFVVKISIPMTLSINFYCYSIVTKTKVNFIPQGKTLYCVCIFSPSNASLISLNTFCSFLLITSIGLNSKLFGNCLHLIL